MSKVKEGKEIINIADITDTIKQAAKHTWSTVENRNARKWISQEGTELLENMETNVERGSYEEVKDFTTQLRTTLNTYKREYMRNSIRTELDNRYRWMGIKKALNRIPTPNIQ